jgi:hypothetical protein
MKDDGYFLSILIVLFIIVIWITYPHTEYMTNSDVASMLQAHALPDKKKKQPKEINELEIYGPHAPPVEHNPSGSKSGKITPMSGEYPDIYGPEYTTGPGKKPKKPTNESDDPNDDTYDFNPDLQKAFPTNGEPTPFLTDFAKFQH